MRLTLLFVLLSVAGFEFVIPAYSQVPQPDSLRHYEKAVIVTGFPNEAGKTPVPATQIPSQTIRSLEGISDVPKIASITPSVLYYSASGIDVGYSYLNIRGFDQSRMSVMVNGVPQNGPEDHQVYWMDIPDLATYSAGVDIQRGSGTAFFGPPAIGGSVNVDTRIDPKQGVQFEFGGGSYGTLKYSVSANSGFLSEKYIVYGRLSRLQSEGYRNASWTNFTSYSLSAARYDDNFDIKIDAYGGPLDDGLYYYGVPKDSLPDRMSRKTNTSESFAYERRPEEKEYFSQPHYDLLSRWQLSPTVNLYNTLFAILGDGYFDIDGTWPEEYYGVSNAEFYRLTSPYAERYAFTAVSPADTTFVNQIYSGHVTNRQYGWMPRLEVDHEAGKLTIGAELRTHRSLHFGELLLPANVPPDLPADYHFYEFKGGKDILNASVMEQFQPIDGLRISASLQLVNINYLLYDEKPRYIDTVTAAQLGLPIGWSSNSFEVPLQFLNPKIGVSFDFVENFSGYLSVSSTSREPKLTDYYNAEFLSLPNFAQTDDGYDFTRPFIKPESLLDFEGGIDLTPISLSQDVSFGGHLGGYFMSFRDELVKSSLYDHFGNPVMLNAARTLHAGLEVSAQLDTRYAQLMVNATISKNEIREVDTNVVPAAAVGKTPVGFTPVLMSGLLHLQPLAELGLDVVGRYVGPLYGDLANSIEYKNDPYLVFDAVLDLDILTPPIDRMRLKLHVNNIFDKQYASYVGSDGLFFPAAPRNFFVTLSFGL